MCELHRATLPQAVCVGPVPAVELDTWLAALSQLPLPGPLVSVHPLTPQRLRKTKKFTLFQALQH